MKINTLITIGLALAPCLAMAQPPADTPEPAISLPKEQTTVIDQMARLYTETEGNIKDVLLSVKDKASADIAALKLKGIRYGFEVIKDELEHDLTPESSELVQKHIVDQFSTKGIEDIVTTLAQQSPPFYGSKDLVEVLGIPQTPVIEIEEDTDTPAAPGLTARQTEVVDNMVKLYITSVQDALAIIQSIKDKETANAAAPKLKVALDGMDEVFYLLEKWSDEEGVAEAVVTLLEEKYKDDLTVLEKLDAAVTALAALEVPFHGANDLQDVFVDEEDETPAPSEVAVELTPKQCAEIDVHAQAVLTSIVELNQVLAGIHDKETADAAAGKVAQLLRAMAKESDAIMEWATGDLEEAMDAYLQEKFPGGFVESEKLSEQIDKLEQAGFHGSEALQQAVSASDDVLDVTPEAVEGEDTAPAELTEEEMVFANAFVDECTVYAEAAIGILRNIKDKETADAAAPMLKLLIDKIEIVAQRFISETAEWGNPKGIVSYVMPQLEGKINELEVILHELSTQEPPFYGSNELESVLNPNAQ